MSSLIGEAAPRQLEVYATCLRGCQDARARLRPPSLVLERRLSGGDKIGNASKREAAEKIQENAGAM